MKSKQINHKQKTGKIIQLKGENQELKEDKKRSKDTLAKLENEIDHKQRYEESQQRFETIFYQSTLGNKIISSDLCIRQVNTRLVKMLGYTQKEMIGSQVTMYGHPDFVHHWEELRDSLWTKKIPSFQIDTCLVRKDGSSFWCQVTSIIFRDQEADMGYTIVEDISKRKAMEEELKKLNEYQQTMMHMVAHDLKNPLINIKSLSDLLKKNLEKLQVVEGDKKEQSLTFINLICDTCEKAQAIIRDLLLVGDFNSNQAFEKTNLKIFIESQLPLLAVEAHKKEITINFHYPKKPIYSHINGDKFARLLENLISNAVKFTHRGGEVNIILKNKAQKVLLQVSDTGIGIPAKWQKNIFDKFTKANRVGTQGETTTGLGLYIVKQIVDVHQGNIWVESEENKGTSFFIELR